MLLPAPVAMNTKQSRPDRTVSTARDWNERGFEYPKCRFSIRVIASFSGLSDSCIGVSDNECVVFDADEEEDGEVKDDEVEDDEVEDDEDDEEEVVVVEFAAVEKEFMEGWTGDL